MSFIFSRVFSLFQGQKVVILEDLAAKFKLKTQAVINRITAMQEEGTLTGKELI